MDRYGPILENALRRAEIPAYQARRHDILEKSVITLLLGAVDAVTGGLEYEDMFRYLKTGLAGITPRLTNSAALSAFSKNTVFAFFKS